MTDDPGRVALVQFTGTAGDRNPDGAAGARLLARALAARLGVEAVPVGRERPRLGGTWDAELAAARTDLEAVAERFRVVLAAGAAPVAAINRCAVALATVPVVAQARADAVVVWFDGHGDVHTPATTTSGYLGGLALAGPLGLWASGLGAGLTPDRAVLVGARDLDPPERALVDSTALTLVPPGPDVAEAVAVAVAGRPVFVHVDCDVLEPGIVPTEYDVPGGLSLEDLRRCCAALARTEVVGVEVGEVESRTGDENLTGLVDALGPVLDAAGARP
ncbi:arginase family protein [Cellulomonas triticagri]|uniref:Arginase family protein n=1 Tax=Cellulomonas triticagri TaxID=2483352 RepID=A0A3M2J245_9CELL|nr:arginase family protein [Cellulomonas triticagri]RMI05035.1 arginase family protein [Cellulomonas triticagri]